MQKQLTIIFLIISALLGSNAAAQTGCFPADRTALRECVGNAADSCRTAVSQCIPYDAGLTITDVRNIAIERCCGRANRNARQNCLKRERRFYASKVSGIQNQFFRAARRTVDEVRRNICGGSTYSFPQSSALF